MQHKMQHAKCKMQHTLRNTKCNDPLTAVMRARTLASHGNFRELTDNSPVPRWRAAPCGRSKAIRRAALQSPQPPSGPALNPSEPALWPEPKKSGTANKTESVKRQPCPRHWSGRRWWRREWRTPTRSGLSTRRSSWSTRARRTASSTYAAARLAARFAHAAPHAAPVLSVAVVVFALRHRTCSAELGRGVTVACGTAARGCANVTAYLKPRTAT